MRGHRWELSGDTQRAQFSLSSVSEEGWLVCLHSAENLTRRPRGSDHEALVSSEPGLSKFTCQRHGFTARPFARPWLNRVWSNATWQLKYFKKKRQKILSHPCHFRSIVHFVGGADLFLKPQNKVSGSLTLSAQASLLFPPATPQKRSGLS